MKAIVCVKQVPDTRGKVAVKADGTMDRSAMATIIMIIEEILFISFNH